MLLNTCVRSFAILSCFRISQREIRHEKEDCIHVKVQIFFFIVLDTLHVFALDLHYHTGFNGKCLESTSHFKLELLTEKAFLLFRCLSTVT